VSEKSPAVLCILLAWLAIGSASATPAEGHYSGVSADGSHSVSFVLHGGVVNSFSVDHRIIATHMSLANDRHFASATEHWHVIGAWHTAHEVKGTYSKINASGKAPLRVQWTAML